MALPAKNSVFSSHVSRIRSKALKHSTRATPTNQAKSPWNQPDCMVKASTFHLPLDLHVCDKNISWLDTGLERFQTLSVQFLRRISSGEVQTSTLRSNRCNGMPRMISWSTSICFISSIFCKPSALPPKLLTFGERKSPLASNVEDGKRAEVCCFLPNEQWKKGVTFHCTYIYIWIYIYTYINNIPFIINHDP